MPANKKKKCDNMLKLFDEVQETKNQIGILTARGLKIRNDDQALHRILREIKEKL